MANFVQTLNAAVGNAPVLLLEIYYDGGGPIYLAQDNTNFVSNGHTYLAAAFSVTLPNQPESGIPTASFAFDNVMPEEVMPFIEANSGKDMYFRFKMVTREYPNDVEMNIKMQVESISVNSKQVMMNLVYYDILNQAALIPTYRPHNFPGLFN